MALFREEAGSAFWCEEFVKFEGKVGLDGIGRSGSEQKHEAFRTSGIWGWEGVLQYKYNLYSQVSYPYDFSHI